MLLKLVADTAVTSSHVRLLIVDISLDLCVDHHLFRVCASCFYRLHQLQHIATIQQSLDSDSLATLICVVVNSQMDYCNTVLAGAPRTLTDNLQWVLNTTARVITGTRKFDRGLGQILHEQRHWLSVPDRVLFKLAVTVHQCLNNRAPPYLSELCIPVSSADTRRHLRSANCHLPSVPCFWLNAYGRRPSGILSCWPGGLELTPGFYPGSNEHHRDTDFFRHLFKTYLFRHC